MVAQRCVEERGGKLLQCLSATMSVVGLSVISHGSLPPMPASNSLRDRYREADVLHGSWQKRDRNRTSSIEMLVEASIIVEETPGHDVMTTTVL